MMLPGRLSRTTLGDLLGRLHRAQASGALEVTDATGKKHRLHLERGAVIEEAAQVEGIYARLDRLDGDGTVRFLVGVAAGAAPKGKPRLSPADFLHGRRRARDTNASPSPSETASSATRVDPIDRLRALRLLGVAPGADPATIRRAFRNAAARVHPDRFGGLPADERARLSKELAALSAAYHLLSA